MKLSYNLPRFSLVQKLIIGFAATAFLAMVTLIFTFTGLYSLNKTVRDIAKNDLVLLQSSFLLRQSLLDQEGYASKYMILNSPEFIDLFNKRKEEFFKTIKQLQMERHGDKITSIVHEYSKYIAIVQLMFQGDLGARSKHKPAAQMVINAIDVFSANQQLQLNSKLEDADNKEDTTVKWTLVFSMFGFTLAIVIAGLFLFNFTRAIDKLKKATHRISEGDFDFDPQIPPGDEIGDLAHDFMRMAKRLKVLEQMNIDASPLTRLPGNIVIEQVLNNRVKDGKPFAVCYVDLDNMKSYNDVYGYIKGSEVIKMAGDIILEIVRRESGNNAFVGHIGGDDFIMVLDQANVSVVCEETIKEFAKGITAHYSPEDVARGGIDSMDRYGVQRFFPIMTISIAVVLCQNGEYQSAVDIAQTSAEIKDYLKGMPGSNYMINRRRKPR